MKFPCYTTRTGIQIGCRYNPPPQAPEMSRDALDLQAALLGDDRHSVLEEALVAVGAVVLAVVFVLTLIKMWRF